MDKYSDTKKVSENNYLPDERTDDGEDLLDNDDLEDDNTQQGGGGSGSGDDDNDGSDFNEDIVDEMEDCEEEEEVSDDATSEEGNDDESSKMNIVEGVTKLIGKRSRAEASRGEESEASDGGLVEFLRRVEALEALELQLTQKSEAFNRNYNDFLPKFKDRLDVFLKRRNAIYTYAEGRMDTPRTFEISMLDMDLGSIGDVPPHTGSPPPPSPSSGSHPHPHPPQVQGQVAGEALQETKDANTNAHGGLIIEEQLARVQVLRLQMIESLQLVEENAYWLDKLQSMMDAYDEWMSSTSSLFSTKSNDLKRRGYNIPLWEDPSTSEISNAVKEHASPPTSPADNPSSSS